MALALDFVSLGMVVLDELRLPSGKVLQDCIGGSGAYSTLGARIVTPEQYASVGATIIAGYDFPDSAVELIRGWDIAVEMVVDKNRKSTRGLLEYHDQAFGRKSFRYITEPLQPVPSSLSARMLASKSFHILRPAAQVVTEMSDLLRLRIGIGIFEKPLVVWEPFPLLCTPEHLDAHIEACKSVDVFSPNHLELLGLYGERDDDWRIESCARKILDALSSIDQGKGCMCPAIVVRAGERGCFVADHQSMFWLRPYHSDPSTVVDATGGGNTFLGALTVALVRTGDLLKAAIAGSVAASFAIEQIGLPLRDMGDGEERWNGVRTQERFGFYNRENISQPAG